MPIIFIISGIPFILPSFFVKNESSNVKFDNIVTFPETKESSQTTTNQNDTTKSFPKNKYPVGSCLKKDALTINLQISSTDEVFQKYYTAFKAAFMGLLQAKRAIVTKRKGAMLNFVSYIGISEFCEYGDLTNLDMDTNSTDNSSFTMKITLARKDYPKETNEKVKAINVSSKGV